MELPDTFKQEKFFLFMVWVALIGAAIILAIDYTTKRQVLNALLELKGQVNESTGQGGNAGPTHPHGNQPIPNVAGISNNDASRVEATNDMEHLPFPIRETIQPRESNGRFAAKTADDERRDDDTGIPRGNSEVES